MYNLWLRLKGHRLDYNYNYNKLNYNKQTTS